MIVTGKGCNEALEVKAIYKMSGIVIAEDEKTSEFKDMPSAAIKTDKTESSKN